MNVLQDIRYLSDHSKRDVSPPSNVGQVQGVIDALAEIRAYYDTLPRETKTEKKKKKKKTYAKGSTLKTQYGGAKVLDNRADGIIVAELKWGTAYIYEE